MCTMTYDTYLSFEIILFVLIFVNVRDSSCNGRQDDENGIDEATRHAHTCHIVILRHRRSDGAASSPRLRVVRKVMVRAVSIVQKKSGRRLVARKLLDWLFRRLRHDECDDRRSAKGWRMGAGDKESELVLEPGERERRQLMVLDLDC